MDKYHYDSPQYIYLINKAKKFRGLVSFSDVLQAEETTQLKNLRMEELVTLNAKQTLSDAVDALEHTTLPIVPVLSDDETLIGEIDWHFALSVQREMYEARLMAGTGMDEGDDCSRPSSKARKNAVCGSALTF